MTDFAGFIGSLLAKGYARNPCRPDSCHDESEHVHLKAPEGNDMIAWADGTWFPHDLTQPARIIYPAYGKRK